MDRFINALQRFGIGRLAAIFGVAAGAAAVLFAIGMNFGSPPKALLYSNLDLKEAGAITQALDQAGIKYQAKGDGSTIMVDRDKVASTRLMLSSKGMPTSGSVGYEIFDQSNSLGQTDFVTNLNHQRALEGELVRTIRSLEGVTFARVQLVLPKRQLFEEEAEPPTASVVLGASRQISADQVQGIQNLVAAAVPGLKPDKVTITDQSGKMLAGGQGDSAVGALAAQRRNETEEAIRKKVKETVDGVMGPGHSRVSVTADLDLSHVTIQEEKFDPDGQVARQTSNTTENSTEKQPGANTAVTTANNLPGAGAANSDAGDQTSNNGKTEESTSYEISKTVKTSVVEPGEVKKLSVSVAVDYVTPVDAKGKAGTPRPLTADERTNIESLVKAAVGFDATRGDQVTVANVKFLRDAAGGEGGVVAKSPLMAFDKNDIMRGAELGVLAIVAGLVIFFVIRPLLKTAQGGGFAPMPMLAG
ncbi:MAG TPA: flagellar basal-body MS-ring/collar protein FliF, partial [Caulobacteraceae bacterium]|nr:flagellar basal-body MS-ring/collar protein FliF [Caulobacteraceae bacterium]